MRLFHKEPFLWELYNDLHTLMETHLIYEEILENFGLKKISVYFEDLVFLSSETKELMYAFEKSWYNYLNKTAYSVDAVFVYLDKDFQSILDVELSSFLQGFKDDMKNNGYTDYWKADKKRQYPSNEQIVERAKTLYGLLIEHKVITK